MQNAAFEALGLQWRYVLLPTPPDEVGTAVSDLRRGSYAGANVTVPHKQVVMDLLDEISVAAQSIRAVNTILVQKAQAGRGRPAGSEPEPAGGDARPPLWLVGHNTDGDGFLAALTEAGFETGGRRALVLGAGGGARAVVHALVRAGCSVMIYNRTVERAAQLAYDLQGAGRGTPVTWLPDTAALAALGAADIELLVNTTPVGMWPDVEASPWPEALPLAPRWTVFDLVYNPIETRLLFRARAAGARAIGGLGMLVHQGALAFELWTGRPAPVAVMRAAAEQALRRKN
jgi:shikimate dehydrogenase